MSYQDLPNANTTPQPATLPKDNTATNTDRHLCIQTNSGLRCGTTHPKRQYAVKHCLSLTAASDTWLPLPFELAPRYRSTDLLRRGWTRALMDGLLGQQDAYGNASEEHHQNPLLYDADRVHQAECWPQFQHQIPNTAARAKKKAPTRKTPTLDLAASIPLEVPQMVPEDLREQATRRIVWRQAQTLAMRYHEDPDNPSRETVRDADYAIRHEPGNDFTEDHTTWDAEYLIEQTFDQAVAGQTSTLTSGLHRATIKHRIALAVAEDYPNIADECLTLAATYACRIAGYQRQKEENRRESESQPPLRYNVTNLIWRTAAQIRRAKTAAKPRQTDRHAKRTKAA